MATRYSAVSNYRIGKTFRMLFAALLGFVIAADKKHHGLENPEGPHAGDMPNFTVSGNGTAKATLMDPRVNTGDGDHSLLANGGTALVIHAKPDDMKSDPAGNAGDRIACGVITRRCRTRKRRTLMTYSGFNPSR